MTAADKMTEAINESLKSGKKDPYAELEKGKDKVYKRGKPRNVRVGKSKQIDIKRTGNNVEATNKPASKGKDVTSTNKRVGRGASQQRMNPRLNAPNSNVSTRVEKYMGQAERVQPDQIGQQKKLPNSGKGAATKTIGRGLLKGLGTVGAAFEVGYAAGEIVRSQREDRERSAEAAATKKGVSDFKTKYKADTGVDLNAQPVGKHTSTLAKNNGLTPAAPNPKMGSKRNMSIAGMDDAGLNAVPPKYKSSGTSVKSKAAKVNTPSTMNANSMVNNTAKTQETVKKDSGNGSLFRKTAEKMGYEYQGMGTFDYGEGSVPQAQYTKKKKK
jgi:F0F1-type ATP synthase membrane subunit c/vacuolar-type H+-ATPase subunit K